MVTRTLIINNGREDSMGESKWKQACVHAFHTYFWGIWEYGMISPHSAVWGKVGNTLEQVLRKAYYWHEEGDGRTWQTGVSILCKFLKLALLPSRHLVKGSLLWEACIHLPGVPLPLDQFFPFPSDSCACPAPPKHKTLRQQGHFWSWFSSQPLSMVPFLHHAC